MKTKLIQKVQILLRQHGATQIKADIYSLYNVTSSKDMSREQLVHLINELEGDDLPAPQANPYTKALRSEVLKLLTSPSSEDVRCGGLDIPNDWGVLNPFIRNHGGKSLPEMTNAELGAFKTKLYAMRKSGWSYHREQPESSAPDTVYCPIILTETTPSLFPS